MKLILQVLELYIFGTDFSKMYANQTWEIHGPSYIRSSGVKVHVQFYRSYTENGTTGIL